MAKLRVGIISANWGTHTHLPAWRALRDDVEVVAICTAHRETAERAASIHNIARPFWDFHAMCADPNIDIIDCGTRPKLRQQMVSSALDGGKHVVNQIPFAVSAEAAQQMADSQRATGRTGIVAASILGLPQISQMKEMIEEDFLGDIFQINCHWNLSFFNPPVPAFAWPWFADPEEGVSVTRNQGSHMLHALLHLFGPIEAVTAQMKTFVKEWRLASDNIVLPRTDDTMNALLRFKCGAMGQFSTSWVATDSPGWVIEAIGHDGYLRMSCPKYPSVGETTVIGAKANPYVKPTARPIPLPERFLTIDGRHIDASPEGQVLSMAKLYRAMLNAIRERTEPIGSFARAAEVQRIIEAFYESASVQHWIVL